MLQLPEEKENSYIHLQDGIWPPQKLTEKHGYCVCMDLKYKTDLTHMKEENLVVFVITN